MPQGEALPDLRWQGTCSLRAMNLEVLSWSETVSLCREAAGLVLNRFRTLAQRADPGDRPLSELFKDLAGDAERSLDEIRRLHGPGPPPGLSESEMATRVARGFLPSLLKSVGTGSLDRESGFYLAECVLGDLVGFYGALVRQTGDERARELLQRSGLAVKARLDFLRFVVLEVS